MSPAIWFVLSLLIIVCYGQQQPPTTGLSQIDMQSLLKSLNMTEGDLEAMKKEITSHNSNSTNNPSPDATSHQQAKESSVVQKESIPVSQPTSNQESSLNDNGMMDLSQLELQLGLKSSSSPKPTPKPTTTSNSQSSSSSTTQTAKTATTNSNQGQIALQGPIPISLPNHLESNTATSTAASTISLLDLSEFERQLGLIPTTPPQASNQQNKKKETQPNNTNQQPPAKQQKDKQSQQTSQPKNSSEKSQNASPPTSNTNNVSSTSSVSVQSTPNKTSNPSSSSKEQQLQSQLARLQEMLEQLSQIHQQSSKNTTKTTSSEAQAGKQDSAQKTATESKPNPSQKEKKEEVVKEDLPVKEVQKESEAPKEQRGSSSPPIIEKKTEPIQQNKPQVNQEKSPSTILPQPQRIEDPVIKDPVIEDPAIEDPVIKDPVIEDPVIENPAIKNPVIPQSPVEESEQPTKQSNESRSSQNENKPQESNLVGKAPELIDISKAKVIFSIYPNTTNEESQSQQTQEPEIPSKQVVNPEPQAIQKPEITHNNPSPAINQNQVSQKQTSKPPELIDISKAKVIYSIYPNQTENNEKPSSSVVPTVQPTQEQSSKEEKQNLNSVTLEVPPPKKQQASQRPQRTGPQIVPTPVQIPIQQKPTNAGSETPNTSPSVNPNWPFYPDVASFVRASSVSRLDPRFIQQQEEQTAQRIALNNNRQRTTVKTTAKEEPNQAVQTDKTTAKEEPKQAVQTNLQRQPALVTPSGPYQSLQTSPLSIYSLPASYKQFAESFVVSRTDPCLPLLQSALISAYPNYLDKGKLTSAFRLYQSYGDVLTYQLLYETIYGTFNAIIDFSPYTKQFKLKSLSVVSFPIMEIDLEHCREKDSSRKKCEVCETGYRNFMGRCRLYDQACLQYTTDECGACVGGFALVRGVCSKR